MNLFVMWSPSVLRFIQDHRHPGLRPRARQTTKPHPLFTVWPMSVIINLHTPSISPGYRSVGYVFACVSYIGLGFPDSTQCLGPMHCMSVPLGHAGGTLLSFSTLSTSVDDPLSRSQELSHLPELTISPPRRRTVLPTELRVVFQPLTYLRPVPIFTGIPWPAMWVVLPEIRS